MQSSVQSARVHSYSAKVSSVCWVNYSSKVFFLCDKAEIIFEKLFIVTENGQSSVLPKKGIIWKLLKEFLDF